MHDPIAYVVGAILALFIVVVLRVAIREYKKLDED